MLRRRLLIGLTFGAVLIIVFLIWRFTSPVEVRIEAVVHSDLPFDAAAIPPVVWAKPGEVLRVLYRIRNRAAQPVQAFGRYEISPVATVDQLQIYLTQCGGLNTFQPNMPSDYEVVFRVQPAGLFGSSSITLRHVFNPATQP